jgi:hypothetical protein
VSLSRGSAEPLDVRAWLTREHEGQLGYATGCGPRTVVVRVAVSAGRLVFRLPEYSSALGYARDRAVTLQIGGGEESGAGHARLVVSGTAQLVDEDDAVDAEPVLDEHWPDGVATHVVALTATSVDVVQDR